MPAKGRMSIGLGKSRNGSRTSLPSVGSAAGVGTVESRKWEVGSGKWEVGSGKWEVGSGRGLAAIPGTENVVSVAMPVNISLAGHDRFARL